MSAKPGTVGKLQNPRSSGIFPTHEKNYNGLNLPTRWLCVSRDVFTGRPTRRLRVGDLSDDAVDRRVGERIRYYYERVVWENLERVASPDRTQ